MTPLLNKFRGLSLFKIIFYIRGQCHTTKRRRTTLLIDYETDTTCNSWSDTKFYPGICLEPMMNGPCHHGMAVPQVAGGRTASNIKSNWECIE